MFKPLQDGASEGRFVTPDELDLALNAYYDLVGWDKATGVPTKANLEELDSGWVI